MKFHHKHLLYVFIHAAALLDLHASGLSFSAGGCDPGYFYGSDILEYRIALQHTRLTIDGDDYRGEIFPQGARAGDLVSIDFDIVRLPPGTHTYSYTTLENLGDESREIVESGSFTVNPCPPEIAFSYPLVHEDEATPVQVDFYDLSGVSHIDFVALNLDTGTTASHTAWKPFPGMITLNPPAAGAPPDHGIFRYQDYFPPLGAGNYEFTATAYDIWNIPGSYRQRVTVPPSPPEAFFLQPTNHQVFPPTPNSANFMEVAVYADDNTYVKQVDMGFIGGRPTSSIRTSDGLPPSSDGLGHGAVWRGIVNIPGVPGDYTLYAIAWDNSNNQAYISLSFRVASDAPIAGLWLPSDAIVPLNQKTALSVDINAVPAPTYQWFYNGQAILRATNATCEIENFTAKDVGAYTVRATNAYGDFTTEPAYLSGITYGLNHATGKFEITLFGSPGAKFKLERARSLGRTAVWSELQEMVATVEPIKFEDNESALSSSAFYRLVPFK